ncbi:DUF411 domain-containing protein [Parvibaculum sp.]|mgnify:FL=1|uniref:DUF411 domain-containing protein n=1 Tax=Parvibaculum sp. TaxID=2024848 RepID=UPI000C95A24A|nr:DUF411 domain-containing protein [Parvibaculum sp.]MAB12289.1 metal-binding protein [Parvibaculum sp.]
MNRKTIAVAVVAVVAVGGIAYWSLGSPNALLQGTSVAAASDNKAITIWRDPGCGCCDAYADYLEGNGYEVTRVDDPNFDQRSIEAGVPRQGIGCHLAEIDGYVVSGLVPVEIIERLVAERPDITGITLPGMPANAPGMAREKTGTLKTFAFGEDGVTVYSEE